MEALSKDQATLLRIAEPGVSPGMVSFAILAEKEMGLSQVDARKLAKSLKELGLINVDERSLTGGFTDAGREAVNRLKA